ncbi:hypothetical protein RHS02_00668, partial [Rhizoctonia solani]
MSKTRRGTTYGLHRRLDRPTEPVAHEGEGLLAPGMMAKSTTPTVSPRPARLPMPHQVQEEELPLLALTSMTFPHPAAVGTNDPKRDDGEAGGAEPGESQISEGLELPGVIPTDSEGLELPGATTQVSEGYEKPGAPVIEGAPKPDQVIDARKPSTDAGHANGPIEAVGRPKTGVGRDAPSLPVMNHAAETGHSATGNITEASAGMPGGYPRAQHMVHEAGTEPRPEPAAEPEKNSGAGQEGVIEGREGLLSATPSPSREEYVTAQGHWSMSRNRTREYNTPAPSIEMKSKFFPHNSLLIECENDAEDPPLTKRGEADGDPEKESVTEGRRSQKQSRQREQAERHKMVVREHLRHEEDIKREEDNYWMEVVSQLGDKPRTDRRPQLNHAFEWEEPGRSATADFEEIIRRFSDQSDGEEETTPNGGRAAAPLSSTPHPRPKQPKSVRVNAVAVEIESDDQEAVGPSFWEKGKWPEVDINQRY